jgi:glycosyltransferase involved in cell wall biosynthesis
VVQLGSVFYRWIDRLAWRRYRRIFPISGEVHQRIEAGGLADASRMRVIHPGVDLDQHVPSDENDYTFFVPGRIMWTKNLELAIDAFQSFRAQAPEPGRWKLRIAGIVDRKSEPYLAALRARAGGDPAIEFRIRPSDDEMRDFYRTCFATLFTAFNEDWGLVVIEAMATGKACVAVDSGGPREIVRHGVDGMLAAPTREAFSRAMLDLASKPALRERIASQAPNSAARFGWQPFIEAIDREIDDTLPREATHPEHSAEAAA